MYRSEFTGIAGREDATVSVRLGRGARGLSRRASRGRSDNTPRVEASSV